MKLSAGRASWRWLRLGLWAALTTSCIQRAAPRSLDHPCGSGKTQTPLYLRSRSEPSGENRVRIRGLVRDQMGPIDTATVRIKKVDAKYKEDTHYAFTNNRGRFTVTDLEPGRYSLRLEAGGHQNQLVPEQRLTTPGSILQVAACLEGSLEPRPTWDEGCSQHSERSGQIVIESQGRYEGSKFLLRGSAQNTWTPVSQTLMVIVPVHGEQDSPHEEIQVETDEEGAFEIEIDSGQTYWVRAFRAGFVPAQLFRLHAKAGHTAKLRVCMKRNFAEVIEL